MGVATRHALRFVKGVAIHWFRNSLWGSQNLGVATHHGAKKILVLHGLGWP